MGGGADLSSTHVAVLCLWQLTHRAMTVQSFHYRPSLYIQTLDLKSWIIRIIAVVEGVDVFSVFGEIACEKQVQPASKFSECLPYLLITHRKCAAPSSSENETQVDALGSLVPELCVGTLPLYLPILLIILIPAMHLKVVCDHCPLRIHHQ